MKTPQETFRRRAAAAIIIAIALLLVLLLAPRFIKTAPIENKIRSLVAEHTGDAVSIQRVDLSLLPRPRLIVRSVGLSFRGTVTGTVEAVHIYPELLPLLLGRIHIAKVRLERPDLVLEFSEQREQAQEQNVPVSPEEQRAKIASVITLIRSYAPELVAEVDAGRLAVAIDNKQVLFVSDLQAGLALPPNSFDIAITGSFDHWGAISASGRFLSTDKDSLLIEGLSLAGGRSSLSDLSGRIVWEKAPSLEITSGKSVIFLQDLSERLSTVETVRNALKSVKSLKGTINLTSFTFAGPLLHPGRGTMAASGSVANVIVDALTLPGPVKVNSGTFKATMDSVSVIDARAEFLDSTFTTSIVLAGFIHAVHAVDVSLHGNAGAALVQWASAKFYLPPEQTLRTPLSLSQTRFRMQKDGTKSLRGTLQVQNGPLVSLDMHWSEQELLVKQLDIQDEGSKASITLRRRDKLIDVSFVGNIHEQTLNRLFEQSSFRHGWIQGDLKAHIVTDRPQESTAEGSIEGKEILLPLASKMPLDINSIRLSARDRTVTIESSDLTLATMHFTLAGTVTALAHQYRVDGDIGASAISFESLRQALAEDEKKDGPDAKPDKAPQKKPLPLQGTLRVKADSLSFGKLVLTPVQAAFTVAPNEMKVEHIGTALCGIALQGSLAFVGQDISIDLKPEAKGLQLEPALACLVGKDHKISGVFDLSGSLSARGKPDALVSSLQGWAEFTTREGNIYQNLMVAKILSAVKASDLLKGKLPDFRTEGLPYRLISVKTVLRGGELTVQELVVDSPAMNIVGEGVLDLKDSAIRMTVLVAPFTSLDKVVSKIPVVNYVLQGTLVSIPVAVSGGINDPEVKLMPASAVGDGVLGILKRTVKVPVKIIEPVLPEERKKEAGGR